MTLATNSWTCEECGKKVKSFVSHKCKSKEILFERMKQVKPQIKIEEALNEMVKIGLLIKERKRYIEPKWCNSLSKEQRGYILNVIDKARESERQRIVKLLDNPSHEINCSIEHIKRVIEIKK